MRFVAFVAIAAVGCAPMEAGAAKAPEPPLAQRAEPWANMALERAITGFRQPLLITHAGDGSGRVFVAEQGGLVKVVRNGAVEATPFLDASSVVGRVGGEQGFLGLAFHPRFRENGRMFIAYTDARGDNAYAEVRANAERTRGDMTTHRLLFAIPDFAANHNGGNLAFGPDGKLYIGTGDGGGANDPQRTAQDDTSLLGKMLVLDVDDLPPAGVVTPQIWAKGLRNPWRYSFDRETGDLWIADVGQNRFEWVFEVPRARQRPGLNFGWSIVEGSHCFRPRDNCDATGLERVVFEYPHGEDGCSITGGHVYRGAGFPALRGTYFVGDYCTGRIWMIKKETSTTGGAARYQFARALDGRFPISSFGEDEAGELWVADHGGGSIRKLVVRTP
jgi:glucose/arabinose dehydrogenase